MSRAWSAITSWIERRPVAAALLVTALAAFLRLPGFFTTVGGAVSSKIVWYDEAYSIFFAAQGPLGAWQLSGSDTTPGLFIVLLSLWMKLVGPSVAALALFPFMASVAAIPAIQVLAARISGGRRIVGLFAGLLLAVNPLHIRLATEVRVYSLLFLVTIMSVGCLWHYLDRPDARRAIAWGVSAVVGLYLHYTFLFVFIAQNLLILDRRRGLKKASWRLWFAVLVLVALACLPTVLNFDRWDDLAAAGGGSSYFSRAARGGGLLMVPQMFSTIMLGERGFFPATAAGGLLAWLAGFAVLFGLTALTVRRRSDARFRSVGILLAAVAALLFLGGFTFYPRYQLVLVLPAVLLAALALGEVRRPDPIRLLVLAPAAALIIGAVVTAYQVPPALSFQYYAPAFAERLSRQAAPGDLVLLDHFTDILFRVYPPSGSPETAVFVPFRGRNLTDMGERFRYFDYDAIADRDRATLDALTSGHRRVWTVDYWPQRSSVQDPQGFKLRWLEENYRLVRTFEFPAGGDFQRTLLLLYESP